MQILFTIIDKQKDLKRDCINNSKNSDLEIQNVGASGVYILIFTIIFDTP